MPSPTFSNAFKEDGKIFPVNIPRHLPEFTKLPNHTYVELLIFKNVDAYIHEKSHTS